MPGTTRSARTTEPEDSSGETFAGLVRPSREQSKAEALPPTDQTRDERFASKHEPVATERTANGVGEIDHLIPSTDEAGSRSIKRSEAGETFGKAEMLLVPSDQPPSIKGILPSTPIMPSHHKGIESNAGRQDQAPEHRHAQNASSTQDNATAPVSATAIVNTAAAISLAIPSVQTMQVKGTTSLVEGTVEPVQNQPDAKGQQNAAPAGQEQGVNAATELPAGRPGDRAAAISLPQPAVAALSEPIAGLPQAGGDSAPATITTKPSDNGISMTGAFGTGGPHHAAAPDTGATPTISARPGHFGQELGIAIARHATRHDHGNTETLTMRLDPPHHGRIEVKLTFEDGAPLRASIIANTPGTIDLLRRESADLFRALGQAGIGTDAHSFQFDSRSGGQQEQRRFSQANQMIGDGSEALQPIANTSSPLMRRLRLSGAINLIT